MFNVKKMILGVSVASTPLAALAWAAEKAKTKEALELVVFIAPHVHLFSGIAFAIVDSIVASALPPNAPRHVQLIAIGSIVGLIYSLICDIFFDVPKVIFGHYTQNPMIVHLSSMLLHAALYAVFVQELELSLK